MDPAQPYIRRQAGDSRGVYSILQALDIALPTAAQP